MTAEVERARRFAGKAHTGQTRWNGEPYILHPQRVVQRLINNGVTSEPVLQAAYLHDVVEDTGVTLDDIRTSFGDDVADLVSILTRFEHETYTSYIRRVAYTMWAREIKKADLLDNLSDLKSGQRRDKYELAYAYLEDYK